MCVGAVGKGNDKMALYGSKLRVRSILTVVDTTSCLKTSCIFPERTSGGLDIRRDYSSRTAANELRSLSRRRQRALQLKWYVGNCDEQTTFQSHIDDAAFHGAFLGRQQFHKFCWPSWKYR